MKSIKIIQKGLGTKAQIGFNEIMAVAWLLFITGVALSVYFIVHTTFSVSIDTSEAEGQSFASNLLYSGAISYYDEDIDRIYPEIIDGSKLRSDAIDNNLMYHKTPHEPSSGKFTLTNLEDGKSSSAYWNEEWFERLKPKSGLLGRGSPSIAEINNLVLIKDTNSEQVDEKEGEGKESPSLLKEEIIVPRG